MAKQTDPLSAHFTVGELTHTEVRWADNTPSIEVLDELLDLTLHQNSGHCKSRNFGNR